MTEDTTTFAPFMIGEYAQNPGNYYLTLFDEEMVEVIGTFEEYDEDGDGHGWEAVAREIILVSAPELEGRMEFDSEIGRFLAHGPDEDALKALAELMQEAFRNYTFLASLIENADFD